MPNSTFKKGDPRAAECGRKGGKAKKPTGTITGRKYYYRGFEIAWDRRRNAWRAKDGIRTFYNRDGVRAIIAQLREFLNSEPQFIEVPNDGKE